MELYKLDKCSLQRTNLFVLSHCVGWYREYKYRKITTFEVLQALRVVNSKSEVSMEVMLCTMQMVTSSLGETAAFILRIHNITSHKDAV